MTWRGPGYGIPMIFPGKRFHCRSTKKFPPLQGSNPDKCKFPECRGNPLELYRCKPVLCAGAPGDYFAMNCKNMQLDHFELVGNYSFDGVENMEIHHARMLSKDAFWNSNHVTVYDSFISGEYLGWNARNLTLVNCTIESLQGMCYIENLKMVNCKLINTTLAFEYSTVDAQIVNTVDSVLNPSGGIIRADKIGN